MGQAGVREPRQPPAAGPSTPARSSSLPKILQHQAALLAAAQGPGLGPVAAVAAQMQHVAAFSLVAAPLLPAAGTARRGGARLGAGQRLGEVGEGSYHLTLRPPPPPAANSSPSGGPGTLPGLPAPIGVNGFGPLTPQTNGQPGSDTLYSSGLSPYPGVPPAPPKSARNGVGSGGWRGGVGGGAARPPWEGIPPCCLLPPLLHAHQPVFTAASCLSPQPRALAWLIPCSRPMLGCTTTQVSLGATRPWGRGKGV